jgi:hypothetical protein
VWRVWRERASREAPAGHFSFERERQPLPSFERAVAVRAWRAQAR